MLVARRLLALVILSTVLVGAWRFASQNAAEVTIYLWFGEIEKVSLWVALVTAFLGGALVAGLFGGYEWAKAGLLARRYRSTVAGLEAEVHQLRNLPLTVEDAAQPDDVLRVSGGIAGRGA